MARHPLEHQRLQRSDFARVYKRGRRAQGALFAVVVLENELGRTRLGLSVSKRHARRAVDRNRVRRVFREAFRLSKSELEQRARDAGIEGRSKMSKDELIDALRNH